VPVDHSGQGGACIKTNEMAGFCVTGNSPKTVPHWFQNQWDFLNLKEIFLI